MSRRVQLTKDSDFNEGNVPTPHSKVTNRRQASESSSSESELNTSVSTARTNRSRRSRKSSRSSNSNSSNSGDGRKRDYRKHKLTKASNKDVRRNSKDRKQKSKVAQNLPLRTNEKLGPIGASRFDESLYKTPARRSPKFYQEQKESDDELNTTPKLPSTRYIEDVIQTPQFQSMLQKAIEEAAEILIQKFCYFFKVGKVLNFDDDDDDGEQEILPQKPYRKSSSRRNVKNLIKDPEFQQQIGEAVAELLIKRCGNLLNFDDDDDSDIDYQSGVEEDRNKNRTPPRWM